MCVEPLTSQATLYPTGSCWSAGTATHASEISRPSYQSNFTRLLPSTWPHRSPPEYTVLLRRRLRNALLSSPHKITANAADGNLRVTWPVLKPALNELHLCRYLDWLTYAHVHTKSYLLIPTVGCASLIQPSHGIQAQKRNCVSRRERKWISM